jgi:hypothetical protein
MSDLGIRHILIVVLLVLPTGHAADPASPPEQIEADWLRQDELRRLPPRPSFSGYRTTQQTPFLMCNH